MDWASRTRLLSLIVITLSVAAARAQAGDGPKLVNLFCEELVADPQRGPAIVDNPRAWEDFTQRLEARESTRTLSAKALPAFRACVRTHREEFELGEFALKGKEFLEKERSRLKSPSLREQKGWLDQEVSLPLVGTVLVRPGREFRTDPVHQENFSLRHAHYGQLWNRFLNGVREKARVYRSTIQLVKNFD